MKKTKVIIPALGLLVLSTAASISGTVAWFSLNTKVSMSGMSVTTKVSSNLMIAAGTAGTGTAGDSAFSSSATQSIADKILEPVSTVNGSNFFYTTNGKADGDAAADDYVAYSTQAAFATAYGLEGNANVLPYVDYVFELKAINSADAARYVDLTKLDLVYTGTAADEQTAFRVAIFVQEGTYTDDVFDGEYNAMGGSATCIMDVAGAVNQTADYAVSAAATAPTSISIMATSALTSVQVPAGKTRYFKITQRVYLEGEDTTCTNETFLPLTDAWKVFTQYSLETSASSSITEISKFASKSVALKTVSTPLYKDGSGDLYKVADFSKVNNGSVIPEAVLNADELEPLNTAFGTTFTRG